MELNDGHVTGDTISFLPLIDMVAYALPGVTVVALVVVERRVVTGSVQVRGVAGNAGEFTGSKTTALKKAERLKSHVFKLSIIHGRGEAVARAADGQLVACR